LEKPPLLFPGVKVTAAAILLVLALAPPALASEAFSDTNVSKVSLAVNTKGEALVTYTRQNGVVRHVLVLNGVNANPPSATAPQVRFKYDYAGGYGKYRNGKYWKTFKNACTRYDGPALPYLVAACKAPDGTYWALQSWQRNLPLLGFKPWTAAQTAYELHVSHWSGDLAKLEVGLHWTYGGSAVGLFGRLTYAGAPVHGVSSTSTGNPNDRYGRNVYIDTFNSAYGPGWARESGILLHKGTGTFCHSFVPQKPFPGYPDQSTRPPAPGDKYRVTIMGPGVTPVVQWEGTGLPGWTGSAAQQRTQADARALWDQLMTGDRICAPEQS
jgi:hypothetical protein